MNNANNNNNNAAAAPVQTVTALELLRQTGRKAPDADFMNLDVFQARTMIQHWIRVDGFRVSGWDNGDDAHKPHGFQAFSFTYYGRPAVARFARKGDNILVSIERNGRRVIIDANRPEIALFAQLAARHVFGLALK